MAAQWGSKNHQGTQREQGTLGLSSMQLGESGIRQGILGAGGHLGDQQV